MTTRRPTILSGKKREKGVKKVPQKRGRNQPRSQDLFQGKSPGNEVGQKSLA